MCYGTTLPVSQATGLTRDPTQLQHKGTSRHASTKSPTSQYSYEAKACPAPQRPCSQSQRLPSESTHKLPAPSQTAVQLTNRDHPAHSSTAHTADPLLHNHPTILLPAPTGTAPQCPPATSPQQRAATDTANSSATAMLAALLSASAGWTGLPGRWCH